MPICFALEGGVLYSAVDQKPKRSRNLRRLRNLRERRWATVLVDHYEEDWSALWWGGFAAGPRARGREESRRAMAARGEVPPVPARPARRPRGRRRCGRVEGGRARPPTADSVARVATAPHDREWLHEQARAHLWRHFAPASVDREVPIIVRGEGCHVWDDRGNRYLDGLSALFCNNIGHGRADIAQAGADQAKELGFFTTWAYPHPRSIELASRIAGLAPEGLDRVFLTSGGSESVDSALKLVRHYYRLAGTPTKTKFIARTMSYHGTTYGAMAATGLTFLREAYEPMAPGACHVPATNVYRLPEGHSPDEYAEGHRGADPVRGAGHRGRRDHRAGPERRRCIPAPPGYFERVREICDEYDVLLISDEVICSWGRIGEWFGYSATTTGRT